MTITAKGAHMIAAEPVACTGQTWQARNPRDGSAIGPAFSDADEAQIDRAARLAAEAANVLAEEAPGRRSARLEAIASAVDAHSEDLIAAADLETALGRPRLLSEVRRTATQLRLFAKAVLTGELLDAVIEPTDTRQTPPKPDMRSLRMPLGPVGIFGASNFPLAFSVLGNDTASALAAGCPVVVKGHPAHPQTSELAARIAAQALLDHGSPAGTFSLVHGQGAEVGRYLVQHPAIQGVGFTGSLAGGRALYDLAAARPAPIPVFAEMGSANPTLLLPRALEADPEGIARQFAASGLQGAGQFCTSPGLVFAVEGAGLDRFRSAAADHYAQGEAQPMLSEAVARHHETGRQSLAQTNHVRALNQPQGDTPQGWVRPALFETGVETLTNRPELGEEIFGPTALVLTCPDEAALIQAIARLEGHLAGSVFAADDDAKRFGEAITALRAKVGRLVFNAFATGAPLDRAIVHAGPYPATTPPFATSLGTQAALRFTRPVSFQNAPESALPPALHDANPWGIERRVAGTVTTDAL